MIITLPHGENTYNCEIDGEPAVLVHFETEIHSPLIYTYVAGGDRPITVAGPPQTRITLEIVVDRGITLHSTTGLSTQGVRVNNTLVRKARRG